jgi:hypothetical protein
VGVLRSVPPKPCRFLALTSSSTLETYSARALAGGCSKSYHRHVWEDDTFLGAERCCGRSINARDAILQQTPAFLFLASPRGVPERRGFQGQSLQLAGAGCSDRACRARRSGTLRGRGWGGATCDLDLPRTPSTRPTRPAGFLGLSCLVLSCTCPCPLLSVSFVLPSWPCPCSCFVFHIPCPLPSVNLSSFVVSPWPCPCPCPLLCSCRHVSGPVLSGIVLPRLGLLVVPCLG